MSRKLVLLVTCSACGKTGQDDGFYYPATFTVSDRKWEYDFCQLCLDTESLMQLIKLGIEVRPEKKTKKAAPPPIAEGIVPTVVGSSFKCPTCDMVYASAAGLAQHASRKHGVPSRTGAELAARGDGPFKCPKRGCKYGAAGNQGLSAHMRSQHGMTLAQYRESKGISA
jgi:hypothetical protein